MWTIYTFCRGEAHERFQRVRVFHAHPLSSFSCISFKETYAGCGALIFLKNKQMFQAGKSRYLVNTKKKFLGRRKSARVGASRRKSAFFSVPGSVVGRHLLSMALGHVQIPHCGIGPDTKRTSPLTVVLITNHEHDNTRKSCLLFDSLMLRAWVENREFTQKRAWVSMSEHE